MYLIFSPPVKHQYTQEHAQSLCNLIWFTYIKSSLLNDLNCEKYFDKDELKFTLFLSNNGLGHFEQKYSFKLFNKLKSRNQSTFTRITRGNNTKELTLRPLFSLTATPDQYQQLYKI